MSSLIGAIANSAGTPLDSISALGTDTTGGSNFGATWLSAS